MPDTDIIAEHVRLYGPCCLGLNQPRQPHGLACHLVVVRGRVCCARCAEEATRHGGAGCAT